MTDEEAFALLTQHRKDILDWIITGKPRDGDWRKLRMSLVAMFICVDQHCKNIEAGDA